MEVMTSLQMKIKVQFVAGLVSVKYSFALSECIYIAWCNSYKCGYRSDALVYLVNVTICFNAPKQ